MVDSTNKLDRLLSIVLVAFILGAIGMLFYTYVIATSTVGERFTEFYILGLGEHADIYPADVKVGEEGRVILGIINREQQEVSYEVKIRINGRKNGEIGPVVLEPDQKWEQEVRFSPQMSGLRQKVEFVLYKDGELRFENSPFILIDVPPEVPVEFYLVGFERQGMDFPRELAVGETASVIFGVFNSEQQENSYQVNVWLDGQWQYEFGLVTLKPGERWEEVATFTPQRVGQHQKVELVLHKNGVQSTKEPLYFWINVRAGE